VRFHDVDSYKSPQHLRPAAAALTTLPPRRMRTSGLDNSDRQLFRISPSLPLLTSVQISFVSFCADFLRPSVNLFVRIPKIAVLAARLRVAEAKQFAEIAA